MKRLRSAMVGVAVLALAGCSEWVDIEKGGCDPAEIEKMNEDLTLIGQAGMGACAAHGAGSFEGEFRCDGEHGRPSARGKKRLTTRALFAFVLGETRFHHS